MKISLSKKKDVQEGELEAVPKKRAKASSRSYPVKTTVNLAMREGSKSNAKKRIPILLLVGILLIAGIKFGVIDMVLNVMDTEAQAMTEEGMLAGMKTLLVDYDKVEEEYQNYTLDKLTLGGSLVSTMEALALVEQYLIPTASVEAFAVQGDIITVTISGVTLNNISTIYNALKADEKITDVRVFTAATSGEQSVMTTCNMTIFLLAEAVLPETTTEGGTAE